MNYQQELEDILSHLNAATDTESSLDFGFGNGHSYIQQSESAYRQARRAFLELCAIRFNDPWYETMSIIQRVLWVEIYQS